MKENTTMNELFNKPAVYQIPTGVVPKKSIDVVDNKLTKDNITLGPNSLISPEYNICSVEKKQVCFGRLINSDELGVVPKKNKKHEHYFKDVSKLNVIDVYRVLDLFNVTDPAIAHAVKKLLVAGGRGAGKNINQDITEAIETLTRWQEMQAENI